MTLTDFNTVIVRYGELGLKSERIRKKYEELLVHNIHAMLRQDGIVYDNIPRERGRIFVALIIMALVTSIISGPAISRLSAAVPVKPCAHAPETYRRMADFEDRFPEVD